MREQYTIRKNDAAACLAAAVLSAVYHHLNDADGVARAFVTGLCDLLSDDGSEQGKLACLQGLVAAAEDSLFSVIHWLYGLIESRGLTAPEIFVFLGRYGARKDEHGQLVLTRPGDGPEIFVL